MEFRTRHDSVTVVTRAKYHCDLLSTLQILIEISLVTLSPCNRDFLKTAIRWREVLWDEVDGLYM